MLMITSSTSENQKYAANLLETFMLDLNELPKVRIEAASWCHTYARLCNELIVTEIRQYAVGLLFASVKNMKIESSDRYEALSALLKSPTISDENKKDASRFLKEFLGRKSEEFVIRRNALSSLLDTAGLDVEHGGKDLLISLATDKDEKFLIRLTALTLLSKSSDLSVKELAAKTVLSIVEDKEIDIFNRINAARIPQGSETAETSAKIEDLLFSFTKESKRKLKLIQKDNVQSLHPLQLDQNAKELAETILYEAAMALLDRSDEDLRNKRLFRSKMRYDIAYKDYFQRLYEVAFNIEKSGSVVSIISQIFGNEVHDWDKTKKLYDLAGQLYHDSEDEDGEILEKYALAVD